VATGEAKEAFQPHPQQGAEVGDNADSDIVLRNPSTLKEIPDRSVIVLVLK
jgi:hypothetical protein